MKIWSPGEWKILVGEQQEIKLVGWKKERFEIPIYHAIDF